MNAFPPPTTPPIDAQESDDPPSRRGMIIGALVGVGALVAGGIVVGVALATNDGDDSSAAEADLTAQTDGGGLDTVFEALDPFLSCLGENLELDGVEVPEDDTEMRLDELPALIEETMAAGEAAFDACSDQLPAEFPDILPGPELLDDLAEFDLDDIPGIDDLWAELGDVLGLPTLEEAEAQLDEVQEQLPSWEEIQDDLEQHRNEFEERLDDFDIGEGLPWLYDLLPEELQQELDDLQGRLDDRKTEVEERLDDADERKDEVEERVEERKDEVDAELDRRKDEVEERVDERKDEVDAELDRRKEEFERRLEEFEERFQDFELGDLPRFEELFKDFDPETLPDLDDFFGQLDEEFGDLGLDQLLEELFEPEPDS